MSGISLHGTSIEQVFVARCKRRVSVALHVHAGELHSAASHAGYSTSARRDACTEINSDGGARGVEEHTVPLPHLDTHTSSIQCRTHAQPTPTRRTQPQHNKACVRNMKVCSTCAIKNHFKNQECCRGMATDSRSFSQASSTAFVSARLTQVDESLWRFKSSCLMYTGACASKACTPHKEWRQNSTIMIPAFPFLQ
jgi:hypothetical protein